MITTQNAFSQSPMVGASGNGTFPASGDFSGLSAAIGQGSPFGAGVAPQGFDLGSIISTVAQGAAQALPGLLMSLLSSQPQLQQLAGQGGAAGVAPQSLFNLGINTPFGGAGIGLFDNKPQVGMQSGGGVAPQGFDLGGLISTIAGGAAKVLPGLLMGLLSAHPQFQQLAAQSGGSGVAPQSLFNFGVNTPFGGAGIGLFDNKPQVGTQSGAGVAPQGFDLGSIINTVAGGVAKALPGLLMGLLSSQPQLQQLAAQGGASGVAPQSLFNLGINTPFGGAGIGLFDNKPQFGAQAGAGVSPQGFNLGDIISTVAGGAIKVLPGLLMGLLSAHPQLQQLAAQGGTGGVAPQSLFNFGVNTPFGGVGLGLFDNKPQFGGQAGAGVAPQGFDFTNILNTIAQTAAQALPNLISGLLSAHPQSQQMAAQGIDLGAIARSIAGTLAPQIPNLVNGVVSSIFGGKGTLH